LVVFTAITAIAVLLEVPDEIPKFRLRSRIGRLQWRFGNWPKRLARVGAIAVVIGVGGEVVFEALMVLAERDARKKDNEIIARDEGTIESNKRLLSQQLERAVQDARVEGRKLGTAVSNARTELAKEEAKLSADEAAIRLVDQDVKRRGPRYSLLNNPHIGKDPRLVPFKGQPVLVMACLPTVIDSDTESASTGGVLVDELDLHAGWLAFLHRYRCQGDEEGGTERWITVSVDPKSLKRTRDAADALCAALRDALLVPPGGEPKIHLYPVTDLRARRQTGCSTMQM